VITLLGDSVTNMFDDKIVTSIQNDMILCGNTKDTNDKINLNFHDIFPKCVLELYVDDTKEYEMEHYKFIHNGYISVAEFINAGNRLGVNFFINFNNTNSNTVEMMIAGFIAASLTSILIHDGFSAFDKNSLYQFFLNQLSKLGNFQNYHASIYFQLFSNKDSLGIFSNGSFVQYTVDPKYHIGLYESFSPSIPKYYAVKNYHTKRLVEVRLCLALLLKKAKSIKILIKNYLAKN
jgi:hypothetical protein